MRSTSILFDVDRYRGCRRSNPWIAGALSIVPGLGQIYNGQEIKGLLLLNGAIVNCLAVAIGLMFEPSLQRPDVAAGTFNEWCGLFCRFATLNVSTMFVVLMIVCSSLYAVVDAIFMAATRERPHDAFDEGRFRDAVRCSSLLHFGLIFSLVLFLHYQAPAPEPLSLRASIDNLVQLQLKQAREH